MEYEPSESEPRAVDPHELNPSGRLYLYLVHVNSSAGINMDHCLANYLHTTRQDLPRIYSAAAEIASYPRQIRESVEAHADASLAPLVLEELARVDAALSWGSVLQGDVERFRGHYDAGTLRIIEAWSRELNRRDDAVPENASEQLESVREALIALQMELSAATDLDPRVRATLLRHVDAMIASIHQFYVGGVEALLDELDRLIGAIHRDPAVKTEMIRRPNWIERVTVIAALVGASGSGVNGLHEVAPLVMDMLQLQSPVVVVAPGDAPTDPTPG